MLPVEGHFEKITFLHAFYVYTYGYNLEPGAKVLEALNYYNNEMVKIPLDTTKTPLENAQRYFEKYNKQKRTFEALSVILFLVNNGEQLYNGLIWRILFLLVMVLHIM